MPRVPPRPTNRTNRSVSPRRGSYAPSPLNEYPGDVHMQRTSSNDLPPRPPSVSIPSLGEEGIEYADLDVGNLSDSHSQAPAQTRNVSSDLKLHAPKPSLPSASAKAKVQAVTRTDSRQISESGLSKPMSPMQDESERFSRSMHSRTNGSRADSSTASSDRRRSSLLLAGDEHGIPEIGQRVPMYPNAGDVQAPSPSPHVTEFAHHRRGRHHQRTRSGREQSLPPGSYGLHGHGVHAQDSFEKAWYEKHPDELAKEEGQYGPGLGTPRPDWALSSDDLNKIVRISAVIGSGVGAYRPDLLFSPRYRNIWLTHTFPGASPDVVGTPEEEVGYMASDEYVSRLATPPLDARRSSQPVVESPLRKMSFPVTEREGVAAAGTRKDSQHSDATGVIHVDDPHHSLHHPDGYSRSPALDDDAQGQGESAIEDDEPILAADEVRPESAHLHPAVSPTFDRRDSLDLELRSRTPSVHSRSNSRPSSLHGPIPPLVRFHSRDEREDAHTPLEDVDEYEPLFPEEDSKVEGSVSAAERFKRRPESLKHRFPSEDIWEDTPNSLQLHATVSTPDVSKPESTDTFESPDAEAARQQRTSQIDAHKVASRILASRGDDQGGVTGRPELAKQRFPSRDIWEDVPESQQLVTTIEPSKGDELQSPEAVTKPNIPPRPPRRPQTDVASKPGGTSPTESRRPPTVPDRPKPQIPARPAKGSGVPSSDGLAKGSSAGGSASADESRDASAPSTTKPKPAVPARPVGNKIAALKAGFLSDLNSRLQLGPQGPRPQEKKDEPEAVAEKAPLSDARKGRARGPARRKPAGEPVHTQLPPIPEIKITETWNVWQVGEDGTLVVGSAGQPAKKEPTITPESVEAAPALAKNMAGESVDPQPTAGKEEDTPTTQPVAAAEVEEEKQKEEPTAPVDLAAAKTESDDALNLPPAATTSVREESVPSIPNTEPVSSLSSMTEGAEPSGPPADVATKPTTTSPSEPVAEDALEHSTASADGARKSDEETNAEAVVSD